MKHTPPSALNACLRSAFVFLLAATSALSVGPRPTPAQGVPVDPTATPNADLAPMPVQGTPAEPTATPASPRAIPTASAPQAAPTPEFAPGVVLVGVPAAASRGAASPIDQVLSQLGSTSAEKLYETTVDGVAARGESAPTTEVYRVTLPAGTDVLTAIEMLKDSGVAFAEPDYLARAIPVEPAAEKAASGLATPNDPLVGEQWGLTKINAPAGWNVVTGTPGTVIAMIDSGIDLTHPDLASRLWVNPGEIPGNSIDDDNNGYIDDVNGWNFVGNNNSVVDDNGHGTQVAGVAAAAGNNGVGIAGTCWNCRIMVVKAMQASGVANYSDIAAAVSYAVAKGARVINLSLGGYADSTALRTAIQAATGSAVVVAGAGNDNTTNRFYPAAYTNVLGVAATTSTNTKVGFSNYGDWVSLAAPGEAITTTFLGSDYGPGSGTSLSSPFVAGLAGLIRSQRSAWSPALVRLQLLQTAQALVGSGLGRGLPDASKAVQDPKPLLNLTNFTINGDANGRPTAGDAVAILVNVSNQWLDATDVQAALSTTSTYATIGAGSASVGDIASGDVKASGVLTFSVASNAGYGRVIPLTVRLTANGGVYARSFPIMVTTRSSEEPVCGTIVNEDDLSQTELLWTSDKTYVATCDINVPAGYTLTIQPGTLVQFAGNYPLNVGGTLIADGGTGEPIRFEAKTTVNSWKGLNYRETAVDALVTNQGMYAAGNILRNVVVRNASLAIHCINSSVFMTDAEVDGDVICGNDSVFGHVVGVGSAVETTDVAWGDLNGDGRLDLAVANRWSANRVYLNDGAGGYSAYVDLGVIGESPTVAWGDANGDGLQDLAIGFFGSQSKIYLNDGMGAFSGTVDIGTPTGLFLSSGSSWGDINGDKRQDLIANEDGKTQIFLNEGAGKFSLYDGLHGITSSVPLTSFEVFAWGDVNQDGWTDLAVGGCTKQGKLLFSDQNGGFLESGSIGPSSGIADMQWIRLNHDDWPDLAYSSCDLYATIEVRQNDRNGYLLAPRSTAVQARRKWRWGDFDGNGVFDLTVSSIETYYGEGGNYSVALIYLNDGTGELIGVEEFTPGLAYTLAWGDQDGNGTDEVVYGSISTQNAVKVYAYGFSPFRINQSAISGNLEANGFAQIYRSHIGKSLIMVTGEVVTSTAASVAMQSGRILQSSIRESGVTLMQGPLAEGFIIASSAVTGTVSLGSGASLERSSIWNGSVSLGDVSRIHETTIVGGGITLGSGSSVENADVTGGGVNIGANGTVSGVTAVGGGFTVGANSSILNSSSEGAPGSALTAGANVTVTGNRFVNSGAGIVASTGLISGNLIANNAGVGVQFGSATVVSNTIIGNRGNAMLVRGGTPVQVSGNNIDGNNGTYDFYADVPSGAFVPAQNNWWGITTTSAIRARIFDWYRDSTKATVTFSPKLSGPSADAPAYVRRVTVLPDTTVGIQTATFDVEFSREILTETVPSLTASGPAAFTLSAPREISGTHAVFDAEITALWPRGIYTLTVADAIGTDGIKIAPNSDYTFTVDYAGFVSDQTPPSTPQVTALSDGSLSKLTLRWRASDAESGITHYRYAVGTSPGGTDVVNWTTIEAPSSRIGTNEFTVVRSGLNLVRGQTYYVSAQARNAGGIWSDPGQSNQVVGGVVTMLPTATPTPTRTTTPGLGTPSATAGPTLTRTTTPGPGTPAATARPDKSKVFVPAVVR